jgi:RecA/RadA recombinase
MLEKVILKMQNLKLIVIDTFAEHFRATDMGYNDRKKMIANALMGLQMIANKYKICVVLVNNMKTGRKDFVAEQLAQGNQLHGVIPGGYQ